MTIFPSGPIAEVTQAIPYSSARFDDRQNLSDVAFAVWATIALIGLTIVSVALVVATDVDPAIFAAL